MAIQTRLEESKYTSSSIGGRSLDIREGEQKWQQ